MFISIATVRGPTQPGTGVIFPQTSSMFLKSASQCTFQFITVKPTSITIVPIFTIFTFTSPGFPAADITISDIPVYFSKCSVCELQLITVAHAFISKAAIGFHTMLLLQITVTTFHSKCTFKLLSISMIPAGVQGTKLDLSQTSTLPWFSG